MGIAHCRIQLPVLGGGGQLGAGSQPMVPPKLKTPRIYPTIFLMDPN